jgi:hypothetical protein
MRRRYLGFVTTPRSFKAEGWSRASYVPDGFHFDSSSRSSASQISLWKPSAMPSPSPSSSSSTFSPYYTQLFLAFWLGGMFCSIILPRLAILAWGAWQALRRRLPLQRGLGTRREGSGRRRRRRSKKRHPIDFTTVTRRGLVVFQHIGERLVGLSIQTQLRRAFEQAISEVDNPNIGKIEIHGFKAQSAPRFHSGRIYDLGAEAMAFDADTVWNDAFDATPWRFDSCPNTQCEVCWPDSDHSGAADRPPPWIRCYSMQVCAQLFGPFVSAVLRTNSAHFSNFDSFPKSPRLELDIDVAGGEITKVPWLKKELADAIIGIIEKEMVWPNRIVSPAFRPNFNEALIESDRLVELETTDPFLEAEAEYTKSWTR